MKEIACTFIFASDSNPSKTYQCLQYDDGSTSCNCFGWTKRVQPSGARSCRHTRDVEAGLGERHAVAMVEQSNAARRTPQRASGGVLPQYVWWIQDGERARRDRGM